MLGKNAGIDAILERIPHGEAGVEIGVWNGDSSEKLLTRASHLHLVDPWSTDPYRGDAEYVDKYSRVVGSRDWRDFANYYDEIHRKVKDRFRGRPVTIHRCTSAEFFGKFSGHVDWVYIDGLHTFEACRADIIGARKIVRPGGFIFGDDYGNKPGVTQAVDLEEAEIFGNQYQIRV